MSTFSNPYPGVNAHLNSALLRPDGGWEMFHAAHIIAIQQLLDTVLPSDYYAAPEKSLQVTTIDDPPRRTTPDIGLYRERVGAAAAPDDDATAPTAILSLDDTTAGDEPEPTAVTIYRFAAGQLPGRLVTRIELLSPANKPGGSHYEPYLRRRRETRQGGINLVEIDYLHTTHPLLPEIPSYPRRDANATPYYMLVSDIAAGQMLLYAVAVDQPLPRLSVPLAAPDAVVLDLQLAYIRTVESARVLRLLADSAQPLIDPDRYTPADQQRIRELVT